MCHSQGVSTHGKPKNQRPYFPFYHYTRFFIICIDPIKNLTIDIFSRIASTRFSLVWTNCVRQSIPSPGGEGGRAIARSDEECGQKSDGLCLAIRPHPISNLSPFLTRLLLRKIRPPPGGGYSAQTPKSVSLRAAKSGVAIRPLMPPLVGEVDRRQASRRGLRRHRLPLSHLRCQPLASGPVGGSDSPPDCHSLPPTALRLPLQGSLFA